MLKRFDFRCTKSIWLIACFISLQLAVKAQNTVTLRGQVFDKTNNTPLSFASIFIPNSGTGVITNEFGEFTYHLPDHSETETISISFIGYKVMYLKVNSINPDERYTFGMEPETKEIKEVKITGIKGTPASELVKKAIRHIYKNYPKREFLLHGYYRDYIKDKTTNDYKNLTEAAVIIDDRGFNSLDYERSRIKLEQIRYNPGFQADTLLNSGYNNKTKYIPGSKYKESNELSILRLNDPIRNHDKKTFSFVNIFDYDFVPNHDFCYESIIKDGSAEIYEINFDTDYVSTFSKAEYWVEGKIYIQSESYAILKFTYKVTCQLPSYSGKFLDLNLEFKSYNDKYYLNYLSMCNYFEFKADTSTIAHKLPEQYFQYRELFVNKIVTPVHSSLKREEAIPKNTILLSNKIPIREGFWDSYNYTNNVKLIE